MADVAQVRVEAVEADARAEGPLVGLSWLAEGGPLPPLGLAASNASVQVDRSERPLVVHGLSALPAQDTQSGFQATGLRLLSATGDEEARILLLPGVGTRVGVAGPVVVAAAEGPAPHFTPRASSTRQPFAFPDGPALELEGQGLARAEGALRLVISGIDLVLDSDQGRITIQTRRQVEPVADEPADAVRVVSREAVLDLHDATVDLPAHGLRVASAEVTGPAWTLRGTTGTLKGEGSEVRLSGQDAQIRGSGLLRLAPSGVSGSMHAELAGPVRLLAVDGHAVAPAAGAPSTALSLAGLGFVAAAMAALHISRGRRRFLRMDRAMDRRDYLGALALARGFHWHPRLAQDADLAQAICHLALGQPDAALRRLENRARWAERRRATRDLLAARAQAALGRRDAALDRLASSLAANPALLGEARVDPVLARLLASVGPQEAYA